MKRILVTGGAGFIGSHLCERLLKEGNDVICLDNYFTGSKDNIRHLIGNDHFELVRHDVTQPYTAEVDEIYNLACPASPIHYQYDPVKTIQTCVIGSMNMLGLAKLVRAKILQASTSEVYGDPNIHPQVESYWGNVNPIGIRSCYDEGKRCAETLFMDYHRQNNIRIKIIRIFNTYGPRMSMNDGRVVSNFIVQALRGEDITIYGDGQQTRSFQYVDDLIEGMYNTAKETSLELGKIDNLSEEEQDALFKMVSLGALKYFILKVDPRKTMLFDPKESIDFNGNTGPFIQYTHARIKSILRKADEKGIPHTAEVLGADTGLSAKEVRIIKILNSFPAKVAEAGQAHSPALIANYAYELAKEFNQYYHDTPILREEDQNLLQTRLVLVETIAKVLSKAMSILGITLPERM